MRRAAILLAAAMLAIACNEEVPPERLPRFESPATTPRLALVLGSGGPRGFAHVGVIKVLEENGIKPDLVIGSSVGAVVGALYAAGVSAAELERLAQDLDIKRFFLEWQVLRGNPASGEAVQTYINRHVGRGTIEQLAMPFAATATRVSDRKLAIFNRGDTGLAVRASVASPGQFEAVRIGNDYYLDGDEASPVPILAARALGAKIVIAVDVSAYLESTPPGVPRDWVAKDERRARQIRHEAPAADILLHPDIGYYAGHDENYRRRVMQVAERFTREQMPAIRAALAKAGAS
ncbi:MAG: patatin-like phospholipase family protein [Usitatibacter sp.]